MKNTFRIIKNMYNNFIGNLYIRSNPEWITSIQKGIKELENNKGITLEINKVLKQNL